MAQTVKNLPAMQETWIQYGLGISRKGNGYLLQYSCLEISINQGTWQATDHGVTKSQTQLRDLTLLVCRENVF